MHKNPFRKNVELTKAANFHSRFSYVSDRIHPGTNKNCEYLAGFEDIGKRREEVFARDGYVCIHDGQPGYFDDPLQMAHGGNTKISRCDCLENLRILHKSCHGRLDHHGRF